MENDFKKMLEKYKRYTRECKKKKVKAVSLKEFIRTEVERCMEKRDTKD
jgi:hypothetical protein